MEVIYNLTDRKPFVKALEEITGAKAVYLRTPTHAYMVDYFTVTREGNLTFDDMADSGEIECVLEKLDQRGFHCESLENDETKPEMGCKEPLTTCRLPKTEPQGETVGLTVGMPLDKVQVGNLTNLLETKGRLIKKALGISELPIEITEEQISFPWFSDGLDDAAVKTYTDFIAAMCKMSREQKFISSTPKAVENEKYAFRCLLLRLGFVGAKYKADRKILLKNLTGSSAFKSGEKKGQQTMRFPSKEIVEMVRREYPAGTKVELVKMDDAQAPPVGTKGTVTGVDDTASILVNWDNGGSLNVIYGEDLVKKVLK